MQTKLLTKKISNLKSTSHILYTTEVNIFYLFLVNEVLILVMTVWLKQTVGTVNALFLYFTVIFLNQNILKILTIYSIDLQIECFRSLGSGVI